MGRAARLPANAAALNTRRKKVMVKVLKVLQNLVMCDINKADGQGGGLIGQVRGRDAHSDK